jgi:hypothetical protein
MWIKGHNVLTVYFYWVPLRAKILKKIKSCLKNLPLYLWRRSRIWRCLWEILSWSHVIVMLTIILFFIIIVFFSIMFKLTMHFLFLSNRILCKRLRDKMSAWMRKITYSPYPLTKSGPILRNMKIWWVVLNDLTVIKMFQNNQFSDVSSIIWIPLS